MKGLVDTEIDVCLSEVYSRVREKGDSAKYSTICDNSRLWIHLG